MSISATMTLFDNEKNRRKSHCMSPFEIMADDVDNHAQTFWNELEEFVEWGQTYRITVEKVERSVSGDVQSV